MNTYQLQNFLERDPFISQLKTGVLSADKLHVINTKENIRQCYIINTQPSTEPGLHWICIYIGSGDKNVEFWDSLGQKPWTYGTYFKDFFRNKIFLYNNKQLQGYDETCGHFCLYFAFYRSRGYSIKAIANSFTSDKSFK